MSSDSSLEHSRSILQIEGLSYWQARTSLLLAIEHGDDEAIEYFLINYPEMARNVIGMAKKRGPTDSPS